MLFLIIALLIFGIVFVTFSSKISAIPFFPSNPKDIPQIIEGLDLKKDQIIIDLGAGTGTVIFAAAAEAHRKGLNTHFVAIEINFILTAIMHVKRLFHPNRQNIRIVTADLFTYDYKLLTASYQLITFYMYVSPWFTDQMAELVKDIRTNVRFVTYYYPIKEMKEKHRIEGLHTTFIYEV